VAAEGLSELLTVTLDVVEMVVVPASALSTPTAVELGGFETTNGGKEVRN
jgi:hypothetical protein